MTDKKADVIVVAGFTGAGKTRWINSLFESGCQKESTLVIINDTGRTQLIKDVRYEELKGGCPCCEGQRFFLRDLQNAYEKHKPEHIIIEVSQMASLAELRRIFDMKFSLRFVSKVEFVYVEATADAERRRLIHGDFIDEQKSNADLIVQCR